MSYAFIFPGQGAQYLKMMDGLLFSDEIKYQFNKAKEVLNIDYLSMLQEESPVNINNTLNTQPLLLTAGYATYKTWINYGYKQPSVLAGHSLGEWTALVAAGVVSFEEGLEIVKLRATLMNNSVKNESTLMVAILGLDDQIIIDCCSQVSMENKRVVEAVNFNCPGQVVVGGNKEAVLMVIDKLKNGKSFKSIVLPVSVPSHCSFMKNASDQLAIYLKKINFVQPKIKIYFNFNAHSYVDVDVIKEMMIKQLYNPVQWTKVIQNIVDDGVINIVECFPGKVLSNFNRRIDARIISYNLNNIDDFNNTHNLLIKGDK